MAFIGQHRDARNYIQPLSLVLLLCYLLENPVGAVPYLWLTNSALLRKLSKYMRFYLGAI